AGARAMLYSLLVVPTGGFPCRGRRSFAMHKSTILVIDDDASSRRLTRVHLEAARYQVVTAEDAAHVLQLLEEQRPDLVLLDLVMPGRDGLAAIRQIREVSIVPLIVLSGVHEEDGNVNALGLCTDDF